MKTIVIALSLLLLIFSAKSFSQENNRQNPLIYKPITKKIDVRNTERQQIPLRIEEKKAIKANSGNTLNHGESKQEPKKAVSQAEGNTPVKAQQGDAKPKAVLVKSEEKEKGKAILHSGKMPSNASENQSQSPKLGSKTVGE
jgi:hypothetical protein